MGAILSDATPVTLGLVGSLATFTFAWARLFFQSSRNTKDLEDYASRHRDLEKRVGLLEAQFSRLEGKLDIVVDYVRDQQRSRT